PHGFLAGLCQIINYGNAPIFSIRLEFDLNLHEMVADPNNTANRRSAKASLFKYKVTNLTSKIETGANNPLNIGFVNLTPYTAIISMPKEITGIPLGQEKQSILLVQPNLMEAASDVPNIPPIPLVLAPVAQVD